MLSVREFARRKNLSLAHPINRHVLAAGTRSVRTWLRSDRVAATVAWALNFTMQRQTQTNWCWAATSASVARFYDQNTTWTQCTIANGELGRNDCCGTGAAGPCNQLHVLDAPLTRVGHFNRMVNGTITRDDLRSEIVQGRPVCARTAWSGGGAHFVAIAGFNFLRTDDLIEIHDPVSGVSNVDYDVFTTSYLGSGSWTHSYFTRR